MVAAVAVASAVARAGQRFAPWSVFALRIVVGGGMIAHGVAKVSRGTEHFAEVLAALHVPAPLLSAWAVVVVELLAGAAVAAGVFVRAAVVPLAVVLLVAAIEVHLPFGFSSIKLVSIGAAGPVFGPPGIETDLLYLAALAVVALVDAPSVATWLERRRRAWSDARP